MLVRPGVQRLKVRCGRWRQTGYDDRIRHACVWIGSVDDAAAVSDR
jgi:hypothetical protein